VLFLEIGGLETLVMELCKHIDRDKFNVNVLCLCGYDPIYREELRKIGVPVFLIKKDGPLDFFFLRKIINLIKQEQINVIHSHSGCFFNAAVSAYFAKKARLVYTAHGMPVETGWKAEIEDKIAAGISTKLVAVSEEIKAHLIKLFPAQRKKIVSITNGVDTELFSPIDDIKKIEQIKERYGISSEKTIIGTVGRLEGVKNYQMLIRSFAKLIEKYPDEIHLVFIGDGSERGVLEHLTHKLRVKGKVSFLGIQYELQNIIPMLSVFVLSSLSEGTSVSLLEAQSCGVPAVVTGVGGNVRIVRDGHNGFLCRVNDYSEMAVRIERLLYDKYLMMTMRHNARTMVLENYNLYSMVNSYEQLYETVFSA
jgi:glycosyltransferase involved in cell wall biosynthesis